MLAFLDVQVVRSESGIFSNNKPMHAGSKSHAIKHQTFIKCRRRSR